MSVPDIRKRSIPVWGLAGFVIPVSVYIGINLFGNKEPVFMLFQSVIGTIPGIALLVMGKLTGKIGSADGVVLAAMGFIEGIMGALCVLCLGCFLLSVPSIVLLIMKKIKKDTGMAFIPFLGVGHLIWIFALS